MAPASITAHDESRRNFEAPAEPVTNTIVIAAAAAAAAFPQAQEAAGTDAAAVLTQLGNSINGAMQRRMAKASERLQASSSGFTFLPTRGLIHDALKSDVYDVACDEIDNASAACKDECRVRFCRTTCDEIEP